MLEFGRTAGPAPAVPGLSDLAFSPGRVVVAKPHAAAPVTTKHAHHFGFRDLLSDLNPLQYIPVLGTLFRAITGEVVPEPVRDAGSFIFSTLIGGPIGAAIDLGELAVEKLTGIDPEKIGERLLAEIGGHAPAVPAVQIATVTPPATVADNTVAWSPAQLAAYGVTTDAGGNLQNAGMVGSDVLNNLELEQIRTRQAIAQYNAANPA